MLMSRCGFIYIESINSLKYACLYRRSPALGGTLEAFWALLNSLCSTD